MTMQTSCSQFLTKSDCEAFDYDTPNYFIELIENTNNLGHSDVFSNPFLNTGLRMPSTTQVRDFINYHAPPYYDD